MSRVVRKQLAETRAQMERDLKRRDREKLLTLRASIKEARTTRTARIREVGQSCRLAKRRNMERAKRARERLRASILRTREHAKGLCTVSRGEVDAQTLQAVERGVSALEQERAQQRQLKAWTRPLVCKARPKGEAQQESDCEVQANIDDPGLRVVWDRVKGRIKAGKRRSRTEAFFEWVAEHTSEVYAIQERDAEDALRKLEQEERRMSKHLAKAGRYAKKTPEELRELLTGVPF